MTETHQLFIIGDSLFAETTHSIAGRHYNGGGDWRGGEHGGSGTTSACTATGRN